ncbi:hypothetical protein BZZ08_01641 [Streptomyces sp. MH60]|nr:hypothetical protein BZZ08_01641 [Streptomyces sp. MH60]
MRPIIGENGDLLYGAQITVREAGLSVKLAQPMYKGPTGDERLTNPYVTANGTIDFWVDTPQRVSVLVESEQHSDVLVYLDAAPPPEETTRSDSPLLITGSQVPGNVLLAGNSPGVAVWGPVPSNSGVTPQVTVIAEDFALGRDPAGWSFTQAATSKRGYVADVPADRGYTYALEATHTGNAGSLVLVSPGFTFIEPGFVSLWLRPTLAAGESVVVAVTKDGTKTVLETLTATRGWGFYRYPLAAGTYQSLSVESKGAAVFSGSTGHQVRMTGLKAMYGGQVPAHTHSGAGAQSVLLGAAADASGVASVAMGATAKATGGDAIAIGRRAQALADDAIAIGENANSPSQEAISIGARSGGSLAATGWAALGADAYVDSTDGTAIGRSAQVYGANGTAIGSAAYVGTGAANALALGRNAQALAPGATALGPDSVVAATHSGSTAVGSGTRTTGAEQVMIGDADSPMRSVVIANRLYALAAVNLGTDASSRLGFFGAEGTVRPVVTGSDGGVLALRNLLGALAGLGLITNNTTN